MTAGSINGGKGGNGMVRPAEVVDFWLGDSPSAPDPALERHVARWFKADAAFDRLIADRFGALVEQALAGSLHSWSGTAAGRLALILLLDQFTRNIFRGSPRAFAGDESAQALARTGIELGLDRKLCPVERHFFYLPLLHAEDGETQALSCACFAHLLETALPHQWQHFSACSAAAERYRRIIGCFGRFPHRNPILQRAPSAAEEAFLATGNLPATVEAAG